MGRYYHGDIDGKFWVAVQSSTDADFFGVEGEATHVNYYFHEGHLDKVKEGIVFTTFHFPEHMVNMVTGHGKDEETMCAEYKVSSVQVQKI